MKHWINDLSKNDIYNRLDDILQEIENTTIKREVNILNRKFIQYANVFPVDKFEDTEFFSKAITVSPNEDFLEIGIGTGITSVLAAINGANVIGVDINSEAVLNSIENARLHNVENQTSFLTSDVFSNIEKNKFDTIYWNVPFCYSEIKELSNIQNSVFSFQYKSLENFIIDFPKYLKPNGRVLIGFSNFWGIPDKLIDFLFKSDYKTINIVARKKVHSHEMEWDLTLYELKK
ncbi:methyltransferase [Porphyromonadaceae bacterium OttesenSCG-928-L07]|nr:methyltransferase [Porphyromonadaceae bacterium OttesenSCG-928-L07]